MTIDDQIKDEKLQYDINREAAKMSALSSGTIDKYEYLTGEEILPSNQKQIIEEAKFTYSPLGKAFEKQAKTIKDLGEKQVDALKSLESSDKKLPPIKGFISKEKLNPEIINKKEKKADRSKMFYIGYNKTYDFRKIKTIRVFGNKTKHKTKLQDSNLKRVKEDVLISAMTLLEGRKMVFKAFESGVFSRLEQSEQSDQSSSDDKYISLKLDNDLSTSSNASSNSSSNDIEN